MKAFIASAAALAAIAIAAPASAQTWGPGYSNGAPYGAARGYDNRYDGGYRGQNPFGFQSEQLARRIQVGVRSGAITQREARDLNARLRRVIDLERRAVRDGRISAQEHRQLGWAYADLGGRIRVERADRDQRYDRDRYGYGQQRYDYRR